MFLPQSQIFKDLRQEAIDDISGVAVEEAYEKGTILFKQGDPADHFYILVNGRLRIGIGDKAKMNYVVGNLGEGFGWSSIVGNPTYTGEVECLEPTKCLKIHKDDLEKVFDNHARSGRVFYKSLAAALGKRFLDIHS